MPEFVLELYVARTDAVAMRGAARRARLAADEGTSVRYLRSIFLAEDETCFLLFHAPTADAVRTAAARAGLPFDHVARVVGESNVQENAR